MLKFDVVAHGKKVGLLALTESLKCPKYIVNSVFFIKQLTSQWPQHYKGVLDIFATDSWAPNEG